MPCWSCGNTGVVVVKGLVANIECPFCDGARTAPDPTIKREIDLFQQAKYINLSMRKNLNSGLCNRSLGEITGSFVPLNNR